MIYTTKITGFQVINSKKGSTYIKFSCPIQLKDMQGQMYLTGMVEVSDFGGVIPPVGADIIVSTDAYGRCTGVSTADKFIADLGQRGKEKDKP